MVRQQETENTPTNPSEKRSFPPLSYQEYIRELLNDIDNALVVEAFATTDIRPFLPKPVDCDSDLHTNDIYLIQDGETIADRVTLSQRWLTASMFEALEPNERTKAKSRLLEIGTGSGYLASIGSQLYRVVDTIEVKTEVAEQAQKVIEAQGFGFSKKKKSGVRVHIGDGAQGVPSHQPYDAIIVTAAFKEVPQNLINQLRPGGKLVVPVGATSFEDAELMLITKSAIDGTISQVTLHSVSFLPIISDDPSGWTKQEITTKVPLELPPTPTWVFIPSALLGMETEEITSPSLAKALQRVKRAEVAEHVKTMTFDQVSACVAYLSTYLGKTTDELLSYIDEKDIVQGIYTLAKEVQYKVILMSNTLNGWPSSWADELDKTNEVAD